MPHRLRWTSAILIGLAGAATGVIVLLAAGLLTGRGASLIADAGARMIPHALAQGTGLSSAAAADVVFALLVLRTHPSLRRDLVQGYEG